ncbi:MAG: phosphate ABC transporter permease subunit PstC [Actinomycetota bacterium]
MATEVVDEVARAPGAARSIRSSRTLADRVYRGGALAAGGFTLAILVFIGGLLLARAMPALREAGFSFLTTQVWEVSAGGKFGIAAVLYWTVVIALIALVFAVPLAVGGALFVTEYASRKLRKPLIALVDLLAAIPSLIYGMWGLFFFQPRAKEFAAWLNANLGFVPIFKARGETFTSSAFIAGMVVGLMIVPIITSVVREVFSQTPPGEKEGAIALGATRWNMITTVVLPFGKGGIIGGSMLGMGRALGETIAVAVIISPLFLITPRILEAGTNSVAALIALRFGEAGGLSLSALMAAGLALFLVTLLVNTSASVIVSRSRSGAGVEI